IYRSLDDYAEQHGGEAFPDNVGFAVPLMASGRESFAPDASWHKGPFPKDPMRFIEGAPTCAVEVRSDNDYGPTAEAELAETHAERGGGETTETGNDRNATETGTSSIVLQNAALSTHPIPSPHSSIPPPQPHQTALLA